MTRIVRLLTLRTIVRVGSPHGNRSSAFVRKQRPIVKEHLARSAEQLRYAVRYLANSSCPPQEKLTGMYNDAGFGSNCQDDFPNGSLKNDYLTIRDSLFKADEPNAVVNIAAMSDEQAREVISQICSLSEAVAYTLGRQSKP
jgi:hypothetical protein